MLLIIFCLKIEMYLGNIVLKYLRNEAQLEKKVISCFAYVELDAAYDASVFACRYKSPCINNIAVSIFCKFSDLFVL